MQNDLFKDILEKYIRERVKNERLENKIARLRSGSKKQHQKHLEEIKRREKDINKLEKTLKSLDSEKKSLKLGLFYRDEILNCVFEKVEDKEIKEYLLKTGILNKN